MLLRTASLAVVICHGSYHTPRPYQPFLAALRAQGIEGYCPQLPTSDLTKLNVGDASRPDYNRSPPPGGYPQPADDALAINDLLSRLIEGEGKYVLLIEHSSGGGAATAAAIPELQAKTRQGKNLAGGVIGIFYECGFMIPVGESVNSFFQPKDGSLPVVPPYCQVHDHGFDGLLSTKDGARYLFNGLDEQTAKFYEATLTASPIFTRMNPIWRTSIFDAVIGTPFSYTNASSNIAYADLTTHKYLPLLEALTPDGGAYINEADFQQPDFQRTLYGVNYSKLESIKRRYDPDDLFYAITAVGSESWYEDQTQRGRLCSIP